MIIKHDPIGQKFFAEKDGREDGLLAYTEMSGALNLHHLLLPDDLQNTGLEEQLIETAVQFAKSNSLKIIPGDDYVRKYMEKKYKDMIEEW